ncbi:hypothetical protein L2E82_29373 [Cichorium intybus]|uniref:Uncharacterized protein n=1 Tax=Cichorium intybus TaxID=13427 RepID=A0ACB9CXX9_CICIN|nr:hypothetical protein L2E82_29373 [Cichorium intybus]
MKLIIQPSNEFSDGKESYRPEPTYDTTGAINGTNCIKEHFAGKSIMATVRSTKAFAAFAVMNSFGFYSSVFVIYMITNDFPLQFALQLLLIILSTNYAVCVHETVPNDNDILRITCIVLPIIFGVVFVLLMGRTVWKKYRQLQNDKVYI